MKSFKFGKEKMTVRLNHYQGGFLCLSCDLVNGEEWIRLSTNLEDRRQSGTHIFVKENEESYSSLAETMVKEGLIQPVENSRARSGYNTYQLYEVLPKCFSMATEEY